MERLTKRIPVPKEEREVVVFTQGEYSDTIPAEMTHEDTRKVLRKLAEYEDLEEQGLLLRLPCHIGDIIYEPTNRNTINEYRVTGIKEEAFALWIEWKLEKGFVYQSIYGVEVGDIGKTVFLTQSEAEQKLKEMESDSHDNT